MSVRSPTEPLLLPLCLSRGESFYIVERVAIPRGALRSPFIAQYLERRPPAQPLLLSDLLRDRSLLADGRVDGLVFHLSRCGSTVVSEMLRPLSGIVAISEAPVLGNLFQLEFESHDQQVDALRAIMALFRRELCPNGEALVFKTSSWQSTCFDVFKAAFPEAPSFFLYRDPVAILTSLQRGDAEWTNRKVIAERLSRDWNDRYTAFFRQAGHPDRVSFPNYLARLLAQICDAIASHPEIRCFDYEQLPEIVLDKIAPAFGVHPSGLEAQLARDQALFDTKSFKRARNFVDDRDAKRSDASEAILRAAERVERHLEPIRRRSL